MLQFWQHLPRLHLAVTMPRHSRRDLGFSPHTHPFHEIGFVLAGECSWQLPDRRQSVQAGELLIVPAGVRHHEITPARQPTRLGWIGFDFANGHPPLPPPLRDVLATGPWRDDIHHLLAVICNERQQQAVGHVERAELALRELLILLCRLTSPAKAPAHPAAPPAKPDRGAELARSAALTIAGNLAQPLRVRDLARYHSLSAAHFSALFRRHQGVSPSRHLQNVRLDHARELLRQDRLTVKEIAAACGYVDAAHFCHAFKAATALTPRQYRQRPADLTPSANPEA